MKIMNTVMTVVAAATIVACATGRSQVATASDPDPNLEPSTATTEANLPPSPKSEAQVASDPDPNEGSSTIGEEAEVPATPSNEAQTAKDPDPNVSPSTSDDDEEVEPNQVGSSTGVTY